jgi:hypothetical protein
MPHVAGDAGAIAWANGVDATVAGKLDSTVASSTYGTLSEVAPKGLRALSKAVQAVGAGTSTPLRWLSFGDSVADKKFAAVEDDLIRQLGFRGASGLGGAVRSITINANTGTITDNTTDPLWVTGETAALGTGATRTYGMSGTTALCDTIKVYWLNVGGTFKIQVDGADNTTPTVTSDNSLGVASITVARGPHTVTVVQLSGSPKIVRIAFDDTTISGLVPCYVAAGGITLAGQTTQAMTNLSAFLADLGPTVITYEMKETQSTFAADLDALLNVFASAAPNADTVLIGSTPVASGDANQVAQNLTLRDACRARGLTYFDGYSPFGSYAALTATGWQADGVHVAAGADKFLGTLMLRFLGLPDIAAPFAPIEVSVGDGATADTPYWAGNTTATPVDVSAAVITFTAPLTGRVCVRIVASYLIDAGAVMVWNLREGSTNIPNSSRSIAYCSTGGLQGTGTYKAWINDLTPGTTHTYKMGLAQTNGSSNAFISLGPNRGPILMSVTAR